MEGTIKEVIGNPTIKVLIVAFVLGGVWFEFQDLKNKHDILNQRLEKKIKVLTGLEKRLRNLEMCK